MSAHPDKRRVLDVLRARMAENLEDMARSQRAAQEGATHSEARPEHAKDTRAIEGTYLARGLAERFESLTQAVAQLDGLVLEDFDEHDSVGVGALLGLEDTAGAEQIAFVVPAAGGEDLDVDGHRVRTVTPTSPLGMALVGHQVDDEVEVSLPGGRQTLCIAWIR